MAINLMITHLHLFITVCYIQAAIFGVLGWKVYVKAKKYLANIFCAMCFFSLMITFAFNANVLIIYLLGSQILWMIRLVYPLVLLSLFFLIDTLLVFLKGPRLFSSVKAAFGMVAGALVSFLVLFGETTVVEQINIYVIVSTEFTSTLLIIGGIYSSLSFVLLKMVYDHLELSLKRPFSRFIFGCFLLIGGFWMIFLDNILGHLFLLSIIGDLIIVPGGILVYASIQIQQHV